MAGIAGIFVLPLTVAYTLLNYWVFRGKIPAKDSINSLEAETLGSGPTRYYRSNQCINRNLHRLTYHLPNHIVRAVIYFL